jgi:hypothetical protein
MLYKIAHELVAIPKTDILIPPVRFVTNARGVMIVVSNIPSSPICCTRSSWVMFSLVYGSHTEQAYSSDGPTEDLYACSLTVVEPDRPDTIQNDLHKLSI